MFIDIYLYIDTLYTVLHDIYTTAILHYIVDNIHTFIKIQKYI